MCEKTNGRDLLTEAGLCFSLASLLPLLVSLVAMLLARAIGGAGYAESDAWNYCSYLLPQLCFAAASLMFFRRSDLSVRTVYARCRWYDLALALALAFGLFSLAELNPLFEGWLGSLGYRPPEAALPTVSGWYLIPAILVIAVLPALFEETVFRGITAGSMRARGWGVAPTVFLTGALFSLFHGNPSQTVYQFCCGVCYTLLAVRSGSAIPTILAHFANNAAVLGMLAAGMEDIPPSAKLPVYLTAGIVLLAVVGYLAFFDKRGGGKGAPGIGKFAFAASVGIAVCAVQWIAILVSGFVAP